MKTQASSATSDLEDYSESLLDSGFRCAEAVLLTVARQHNIESPLIPAIATGFCSGISQTSGMCGAVSGGILGLNLVYGRDRADESAGKNYAAVQSLVTEFKTAFGATGCSELLGCDLGTAEGKQSFREHKLHLRCREYTRAATRLALALAEDIAQADKS